jgi:hypothetical protein
MLGGLTDIMVSGAELARATLCEIAVGGPLRGDGTRLGLVLRGLSGRPALAAAAAGPSPSAVCSEGADGSVGGSAAIGPFFCPLKSNWRVTAKVYTTDEIESSSATWA